MTSSKITLYGHITYDNIFNGKYTTNSVGSMGNVWRALLNLSQTNSIHIEPTEIGEALILVDRARGKRASSACLSLKSRVPNILNSDWAHILYINQLKDISFIKDVRKQTKIVSADICAGRPLTDTSILQYVDYLFISDEDMWLDSIEELASLVKGWVILHHSAGSICCNGVTKFKVHIDNVLKDINILGAGDIFAASVITNILKEKDNMENIIKTSHNCTYNLLKSYNE